jgi:glutamate-1-semialdehyde 2,1-aminomutase
MCCRWLLHTKGQLLMADNWEFSELDTQMAAEMDDFLPPRLFDAHCHLYRLADLDIPEGSFMAEGLAEVTLEEWRRRVGMMAGHERLSGALFIPDPRPAQSIDIVNDYVIQQVATMPESRAAIIVAPQYGQDSAIAYLDNPQVVALKPYHTFSPDKPTFYCDLDSFLPEWAWRLAHERGLTIVLHMVKERALADPDNQRQIRAMCEQYPNAKLSLAHAARGFHSPNTVSSISSLRGLENVYFDTAAVCEPAAMTAILYEFGPRKLMWATDFPISEMRGKCVTIGSGFAWLDDCSVDWDNISPACERMLVGLETLRAVRETCEAFGCNEQDIQDIFCDNAQRLFGVREESSTLTDDLYTYAKEQRIPGGTQLLSKRPEMFAPDQWPAYFREARCCELWDLDGRHYYDFSINGVSACLLGYRDPDVTSAVTRRLNLGSMSTLNPPEEVALADKLCELHPWAEHVRFARSGGETAVIAVRIARATTDRSLVAICGYHGWHDWYLAANLGESDELRGHLLEGLDPLGVPTELRGTSFTFTHGNLDEFEAILQDHGDRLAAVIMEPGRYHAPPPGFLEAVRDGAHRHGALLIFDEISIGWRLEHGGSHLRYGVNPDIAIFSKALGNGHPIGAVIGTRPAMSGAHNSFISSTQWTESVGPVAALATIDKLKRSRATEHVAHIGSRAQHCWRELGHKHGLPVDVEDGYPCLPHFTFEHELLHELRTLYAQWMLQRGILGGTAFSPTMAHTDALMDMFTEAVDEVFAQIAEALDAGEVHKRLRGPVAHRGFQRLL